MNAAMDQKMMAAQKMIAAAMSGRGAPPMGGPNPPGMGPPQPGMGAPGGPPGRGGGMGKILRWALRYKEVLLLVGIGCLLAHRIHALLKRPTRFKCCPYECCQGYV